MNLGVESDDWQSGFLGSICRVVERKRVSWVCPLSVVGGSVVSYFFHFHFCCVGFVVPITRGIMSIEQQVLRRVRLKSHSSYLLSVRIGVLFILFLQHGFQCFEFYF